MNLSVIRYLQEAKNGSERIDALVLDIEDENTDYESILMEPETFKAIFGFMPKPRVRTHFDV